MIRGHKLFQLFFTLLLLVALTAIGLYFLTNEKNYNSILTEYISTTITQNCNTISEKISTLRDYVHENISPVQGEKNRADTVGVEKLVSGIGWCDQMSRVFMQLAKKQGITTRLLFLVNEDGSSPHSIAEAWDGKKWVIVDAAYNLDLRNKEGFMVSREDIENDFDILLENPRIKRFAAHHPIWNEEEFLSIYYRLPRYINTRKGSRPIIIDYVPSIFKKAFVYFAQEIYLLKKRREFRDETEFLFYKARNYHLAGRTETAEGIYNKILEGEPSPVKDKTRYFLALLLYEQERHNEAIEILTQMIENCENNSWRPYAYGLRSHMYEIVGNEEKAREDFKEFSHNTDAYF